MKGRERISCERTPVGGGVGGVACGLAVGGVLALGSTFGTVPEAWSWGPALLALAVAVIFGVVAVVGARGRISGLSLWLWLPVLLCGGWIGWRAANSPVAEFARMDGLLLGAGLVMFWLGSELAVRAGGARALGWGLLAVTALQAAACFQQLSVPGFQWLYGQSASGGITGFFGHYIFFSNFMGGIALLMAGLAVLGTGPAWERASFAIAAVVAAACVILSGARGGTIALALGSGVFFIVLTFLWRSQKRRGFAAIAGVGLVGAIAAVGLVPTLISRIQAQRGIDEKIQGVEEMVIHDQRNQYFSVAIDTMLEHPALGGGSRSFSWESYGAWDFETNGYMRMDLGFVHNEYLQLATDYGLVAAALVCLTIAGIWIASAVWNLVPPVDSAMRAWMAGRAGVFLGAAAASVALLAEAFFSFAFHLLPSTLLLGLAIGLLAGTTRVPPSGLRRLAGIANFIPAGLSLVACVPLVWCGWQATRALLILQPLAARASGFSSLEDLQPLREAARHWPTLDLLKRQGSLLHRAAMGDAGGIRNRDAFDEMVEVYREGRKQNPFDPKFVIELANADSVLGNWDAATAGFIVADRLQGGFLATFGVRYYYVLHLHRMGHAMWMAREPELAKGIYTAAFAQMNRPSLQLPIHVTQQDRVRIYRILEDQLAFFELAGIADVPWQDPMPIAEIDRKAAAAKR